MPAPDPAQVGALIARIRKRCRPGLWSQGMALARAGAVVLESADADEMSLRVRAPGRVVPPTVVLYPSGDEWECDCPSRVNPCEHVAAAAIALGPREGEAVAPPAAADTARVGYLFTRGEAGLHLARVLVAAGGTEAPIAAPLTALLADPAKAARVQVEEVDLQIDRLLALGSGGSRAVLPGRGRAAPIQRIHGWRDALCRRVGIGGQPRHLVERQRSNRRPTLGRGWHSGVEAYGALRQAEFPASIGQLIRGRQAGFATVRFAVARTVADVSLRYRDGVTDATRLVAGRWPVDLGMPLQLLGVVGGPPVDLDKLTVFEAALSTATADTIGVRLGDRLQVSLDNNDPLLYRQFATISPTEIEVVGLFEPLHPDADDWAGSGLIQPAVRQGATGIEAIYAAAYVSADEYSSLYQASFLPFRYDWRYVVDAERLDASQVDALLPDLRRLDLIAPAQDERICPTWAPLPTCARSASLAACSASWRISRPNGCARKRSCRSPRSARSPSP